MRLLPVILFLCHFILIFLKKCVKWCVNFKNTPFSNCHKRCIYAPSEVLFLIHNLEDEKFHTCNLSLFIFVYTPPILSGHVHFAVYHCLSNAQSKCVKKCVTTSELYHAGRNVARRSCYTALEPQRWSMNPILLLPVQKKEGIPLYESSLLFSLQRSQDFLHLFSLCIFHNVTIQIHCHCKGAVSQDCL